MTPNLRLEQHCRVATAQLLGQKLRDSRERIIHDGYKTLTLDEIYEELQERRGECELERMV